MAVMYSQKAPVLFGAGALNDLGGHLGMWGVQKVVLVYDAGVKAAGIGDKVAAAITDAGFPVVVYDQVPPDPPDTVVDEVAGIVRAEGADCIVAVGGGSTLDTAKGANFVVSNDLESVRPYIDGPPVPMKLDACKVVTIPTTSGTGSECTFVAVLSDTEKGIKGGVMSWANLAVLDPELTLTVPPHVTTMTGLDALAHAMESYTSTDRLGVYGPMGLGLNPKAAVLDLSAIQRIFKYLPVAYEDGSNLEARTNLSIAANFAGIAFSDTMVQLGHAAAEELGGALHLPHGFTCANCLPACMEITAEVDPDRVKDMCDAAGIEYPADVTPVDLGVIIGKAIRDLMHTCGLKSFEAMGFTYEDVSNDQLVQDTIENWAQTLCPADVTPELVKRLLDSVYNDYK